MTQVATRPAHVLLLYRRLLPSVRLCGHLQMESLARKGLIEYRHKPVFKTGSDDFDWADIVVLGRLDNSAELRLARAFKSAGKYLIYILDDDLPDIPAQITSARYYHLPQIRQSILEFITLSDAILSPNPLLLEKYAVSGQLGMLTDEPAVNRVAYAEHSADAPVKIGFAGSVDRTGDLESVLGEALLSIKTEYGDRVQFFFFGAIPSFAAELDARTIPYTSSYDDYRTALNEAQWDIGLAPMPDTPFHACKHYNKFCEYAAAGIAGVFSACGPYLRLKHKISADALCANETDAWRAALKTLIDNRSLRESRRKEACECARTWLDADLIAQELYESCPQVFAHRAPRAKVPVLLRILPLVLFFTRLRLLVAAHGRELPMHIIRQLSSRLKRKG